MDQGKNNHIKAKQHDSYMTMSILCFLVPIVGIVLGIVYLTKDNILDKKLGEHMLAFSLIWMLVGGFIWFFWMSTVNLGNSL